MDSNKKIVKISFMVCIALAHCSKIIDEKVDKKENIFKQSTGATVSTEQRVAFIWKEGKVVANSPNSNKLATSLVHVVNNVSINVDKNFGISTANDTTKNYPKQEDSDFEDVDYYLLQNETQNFLSTFKSVNQRNVIKLQLKYCPYTRLCGFSFDLSPKNEKPCCKNCSCDFPACMQNISCCPDIIFNHINMFNSTEVNNELPKYLVEGQRVQKRCIPLGIFNANSTGIENIYGYSTCPLDTEAELVHKCTRKYNANNIQDVTDTIPVIRKETSELYRNLYCALCNGMSESQVEKVQTRVSCYTNLRSVATKDILHAIYADDECKIDFLPDGNFDKCKNDIVSDCNDSGTFEGRACSMYTSIIYVNYEYFSNVFCSLCNGNVPETSECLYGEAGSPGRHISFSGLLKLDIAEAIDYTVTSGEKCLETQIHDTITDSCRDLTCSYMTVLQHGKCIHMFKQLQETIYAVSLRLKPISPLPNAAAYTVANEVTYYVGEILNGSLCAMQRFNKYNMTFFENGLPIVVSLEVRAQYYLEHNHDPYQVTEEILKLDKSDHTVLIKITNENITFKLDVRDNKLFDTNTFSRNYNSEQHSGWNYCRGDVESIDVLSLTTCPKVNISVFDVPWLEIEEGVKFVRGDYIIASSQYYFFDENHIMLCAEKYRQYVSHLSNPYSPSSLSAEAIVSIACSAISIMSLCFTFFIFCFFSQLRQSIPGKNNMSLVFTLLCAQSFYLIGSFGGFEKTSPECTIVGILVHFSWLVALFWMNICTFHMFRVLTRNKVISRLPGKKRFAFYHFYALTMAAILISVNIAVSKSMYGTTGYGEDACYISSQRMIIYTFVIPTGVIILSNLVMFIVVIVKIKTATSVQKSVKNERNDIIIFAKLSTITGITWSFGFLYLWTNITAMSYLFILMNASQGVFIMFAFVINKRVLDLFKMHAFGLTVTP